MHRIIAALALLLVVLAAPPVSEACTVCFGEASGPMIDGARMGVWLLFGLTACMQIAFVAFFVRLYRKAKSAPDRVAVRSRMRLIKGAD